MSMIGGYDMGKELEQNRADVESIRAEVILRECELNQPRWGIVDSKRAVAINLTYNEAVEQIASLNGYEATIVPMEVAQKMLDNDRIEPITPAILRVGKVRFG